MAEFDNDDFLDVPREATPAYAEETLAAPQRRRLPTAVSTGAWLAGGLVIGVVGVAALHSHSSTTAAGTPAASANQVPGATTQQPPGVGGRGPGFGGPGFGGRGGGLAGEQHIVGTLKAVGSSSITVTGSSGTATYPIESSTLLIKDGQRVSSLSALNAGDTVVVHVYPSNGSTHVEMVIDGGSGPANGDGTSTTTTET